MTERDDDPMMLRENWGPGPWHEEPDRAEWQTEAGLYALARRIFGGAWGGYVAVPRGHPAFGRSLHELTDLNVHGGVSYANSPERNSEVGYVPRGEFRRLWWIGFDCGHGWDHSPGLSAFLRRKGIRMPRETLGIMFPDLPPDHPLQEILVPRYRTLGYVRGQCEELAAQLAAMGATVTNLTEERKARGSRR